MLARIEECLERSDFAPVNAEKRSTDRQNLTLALRNFGRYEETLEQYRANIYFVDKIIGPLPDMSRALYTLGTTLYHMARYEEPETAMRRGVAVVRASLGDHPTTATALNNPGLAA